MRGVRQTVFVVSQDGRGLFAELVARIRSTVDIRHCNELPRAVVVKKNDVVVLDLVQLRTCASRRTMAELISRAKVVAVAREGNVSGGWLGLPGGDRIEWVFCDKHQRVGGYGPVCAAVRGALGELSVDVLVSSILQRSPPLEPLADLVDAICRFPWLIRRPFELAMVMSFSRSALHRRVQQGGFQRVEHFITCVRNSLVGIVREELGYSRAQAGLIAGVSDLSNHRRQVSRAKAALR